LVIFTTATYAIPKMQPVEGNFENTFTYNDGDQLSELSEGVAFDAQQEKGCNVLTIAGNVSMQVASWLNWVIIGTPTVQAPGVTIQAFFPAGPKAVCHARKIAVVGLLAASIAAAGAANYSTTTVGTVNGNNLAFTAATGNSDSYATLPTISQTHSPPTLEGCGTLTGPPLLSITEKPSP
jgi:hypothetical protein